MNYFSLTTGLLIAALNPVLAQDPVWDGNKVVLEVKPISDNVFAVIPEGASEMAKNGYPVATTSGFIVGDDGVLIVETMLNKRLTDQLLTIVKETTDKPVKYAVNTSHHGDHSYGNQYLGDDVVIIQHQHTADYIDNYIEQDKAFMMQNFGEGRGIEEIEATDADMLIPKDGSLTIDLGGVSVDVRDYGFAQTGGDLFVFEPSSNTLWTGNAVVAQAPALPWLLDGHLIETRDTLQKVYEATDANTKVVPGHGPITDNKAIKWAVDYLSEVESSVQSAIDKDLSLEDTVTVVQMPDYQGYALFGWVHPGLNVPAAYNDLKQ